MSSVCLATLINEMVISYDAVKRKVKKEEIMAVDPKLFTASHVDTLIGNFRDNDSNDIKADAVEIIQYITRKRPDLIHINIFRALFNYGVATEVNNPPSLQRVALLAVGYIATVKTNFIGDITISRLFTQITNAANSSVRGAAVSAIGAIATKREDLITIETVKSLINIILNDVDSVRESAAEAIGSIAETKPNLINSTIINQLFNMLTVGNTPEPKAIAAIGSIATVKPDFITHITIDKLISMIKADNSNAELKTTAVRAVVAISMKRSDLITDTAECDAFFELDNSELRFEMTEATLVGEGSFGNAYQGQLRNQKCVVERLDYLKSISVEVAKNDYDEKEITTLRKHANIQQLLGVSLTEGLLVSMPYDTSLFDFLYLDSVVLSPLVKLNLIKDIVCAIQYLHANDVVHGDIRPINILLVKSPLGARVTAKVTGFGITRALRNKALRNLTSDDVPAFSLGYMSPELLKSYQSSSPSFTPFSDMYALGITINEIMTESVPWTGQITRQELIAEVKNGKRPPLFKSGTGKSIAALVGNASSGCLSGNHLLRPSANLLFSQINDLKETAVDVTSARLDNQVTGDRTNKSILDGFPIMEDAAGLYTYDESQASADKGCSYRFRGSELFLLAHYYRNSSDMSEGSYLFVQAKLAEVDEDTDTGYVINNTRKVMRDALGLYTLPVPEEDAEFEEGRRIYGNDLLLLARQYGYVNELSVNSYYFIKDSYPEMKSEKALRCRGNEVEVVPSLVRHKGHKYETCGIFSTGLDGQLNVGNDRNVVRDYRYNHFGGSITFDGNSGFKEDVIGNLTRRYLPAAQFRKSDLVVCFGGHGVRGSGDYELVAGGINRSTYGDALGQPVHLVHRNLSEVVSFKDFMSAVQTYNDTFSPRVTVHVVLFSCFSGHWIEKLRVARERNPSAYPDIGMIITAADKDHPCEDILFANAFWGKAFGTNDRDLAEVLNSNPLKYSSASVEPSASSMTRGDFEFFWFCDGQDWKVATDSTLESSYGVTESKDNIG